MKSYLVVVLFLLAARALHSANIHSRMVCGLRIAHLQPQQVHLSLAADGHSYVVTWVTYSSTESRVEFGAEPLSLDLSADGEETKFLYGHHNRRKQYVHRAKMSNLMPSTQYFYRVGGKDGWSGMFTFLSLPDDNDVWSPSLAIYGDLGAENAQSLTRLQKEAQESKYHMILHVGDFAYDLNDEEGCVGDEFMRQIEPIASYVPYMTCPGNHEQHKNFTHYKNRFTMPERRGQFHENGLDMFYSFNLGPAHFISVNTEYYYFLQYGAAQIIRQYRWLVQDLKEANSAENRSKRPWIIVFGHRPMYCSDADRDDCVDFQSRTRSGVPWLHIFGLEDLLFEYNVDLAIWAHEHDWERFWPVYNWTIRNGSLAQPYTDPKATTHIITGSAGNKEKHDSWLPQPDITAFRALDYGYTRLVVQNRTHLHISQVSDDQDGEVIDSFWLISQHRGFQDTRRPDHPEL